MHDADVSLRRLSVGYGLLWVTTAMLAAPGPSTWVELSGSRAQAGVYFALFSVSAAAGAALGGRAMDRWGRRPTLVGALVQAALGFLVAAAGALVGSLAVFAAGVALSASAAGTLNLGRVAAAEMFDASLRARAVARVQVSATAGAVLGPLLLLAADPLGRVLGRSPALLLFLAAVPILVVAALVTSRAHALRGPAPRGGARETRREPLPRAPLAVGVVALVLAQAAMVTVMGVTGVELGHAGHGSGATALVMALHFVGMFGLSLVVGRIADRAGRARTILVGLATMAAGGLTVATLAGAPGLAVGLLLVGLGWSFAYIGGSVLLTDHLPASRRARVIGMTDLTTALVAAGASLAGGLWYDRSGIGGLGLAAAALVAIPAVVTLALRARTAKAAPAPS